MNEATKTNQRGETVTIKVGDWVGFKADCETAGQIQSIEWSDWKRDYVLTLVGIEEGNYGQRTAEISMDDIWTN